MKTLTTLVVLREHLDEVRSADPTARLGLVPTMGFLHAGHISLVERARAENDLVAASIFANPAQFNNPEDLAKYPRDIDRDTQMLAAAGCDIVFIPSPEEIYGPEHQTWVEMGAVAGPLEGEHRPGHFRGVATIVLKLFNMFGPSRAYFGQKDAQQLAVIRTMVRDLNHPVEVVGCPTVREADGLAMSSRNSRLTPEQRAAAPVLYRALSAAQAAFSGGETQAGTLLGIMHDILGAEALARPEYLSIADPISLQEREIVQSGDLVSMAVFVGAVRLIDNIALSADGPTKVN